MPTLSLTAVSPSPGNRAVAATAILCWAFGILHILGGALLGISAVDMAIADEPTGEGAGKVMQEAFSPLVVALGIMCAFYAALALVTGALSIAAGVGVIKRKGWGRALAVIAAVESLLLGGLMLQEGNNWALLLFVLYLTYGLSIFILLRFGGTTRETNAPA